MLFPATASIACHNNHITGCKYIILSLSAVLTLTCVTWRPLEAVHLELDANDWAMCGGHKPSTLSNALPNVYKCPNDPYKNSRSGCSNSFRTMADGGDEPTLKDEIMLNVDSSEVPFFVSLRIKAKGKGTVEGWPKGEPRHWMCPGILLHSNKVLVSRKCVKLYEQDSKLFSIEAVFKPQPERGDPLPMPPTSSDTTQPPLGPSDSTINGTYPIPPSSTDPNPAESTVWRGLYVCRIRYQSLGPTKPNSDKPVFAELMLVRLEAHVRYGQGIGPPCLPVDQTDGHAECALIKLASNDVVRRSLAITAVIVNRTQSARGGAALEVGHSRWKMFQLKGNERVCMQDFGAPIVCKYQCALGHGKYVLAGIVSGVGGAPNWDTAHCQKEEITNMPIEVLDIWERRQQIYELSDGCTGREHSTPAPDDRSGFVRRAPQWSQFHLRRYYPVIQYLR